MSYSLVIEGTDGARRVREGRLPRRGEWLAVEIEKTWWWLPVLEVAHSLSRELQVEERGCDLVHERAEPLVFTSLALAQTGDARSEVERYRAVYPPTRWPLGGRLSAEELAREDGRDSSDGENDLRNNNHQPRSTT